MRRVGGRGGSEWILDTHDHHHVFAGADGGLYSRSNFSRRFWRPATDGDPRKHLAPVIPGMHFHDLRHTHKTWMIEGGVPEVAQAKRLGHRLPGVRGIYSHVSPIVEQRLVGPSRGDGRTRRKVAASSDHHGDIVVLTRGANKCVLGEVTQSGHTLLPSCSQNQGKRPTIMDHDGGSFRCSGYVWAILGSNQ